MNMDWRVATSLETLRQQLNARFPGRSTASDGGIGDAAHQTSGSASDHNPWYGPGIVTARDFTHDPAHGVDIQQISDQLLASQDPRIKYVIANSRIGNSRSWQWGPYNGANPHEKHFHLSVVASPLCDDGRPWNLPVFQETPEDRRGEDSQNSRTGTAFMTWGTGVNIRQEPRLDAPVVAVLTGPTQVRVSCQREGETVTTAGHTNNAWSFLPEYGGYVSNIFIDHPSAWLPDIATC
ncbi:SH3 domain-containing protein [Streptomyces anulatus]|uniref:SH3 domain-containing protein n=2 Tax=Streptomyces TaxID=1883 RepID=UPI003400B42B